MAEQTLDTIVTSIKGLGESLRKIGDGKESSRYVVLAVLDSATNLPPETRAPLYAEIGEMFAYDLGKHDKGTPLHDHLQRMYDVTMGKAGGYGPTRQ